MITRKKKHLMVVLMALKIRPKTTPRIRDPVLPAVAIAPKWSLKKGLLGEDTNSSETRKACKSVSF